MTEETDRAAEGVTPAGVVEETERPKIAELKEGFRRVRYNGRGGASIDTQDGTWNIHAEDWHPQYSPIKDVKERDAQNLVDTSLFFYEE